MLEDLAEYLEWYSEKKVLAAKAAILAKESAENGSLLYKRPSFSSDNQKPVYDRDGSTISSAKIEPDGSVASNFSIICLNNVTAITKASNADCYQDNLSNFKKDGMYISEYRLDYPMVIEEILEVELESPSDFNRVQYTPINSELEYLGVFENNKVKLKLTADCMEKSKEAFIHEAFKGSNLDSIEESIGGQGRGTIYSNTQVLQDKLRTIDRTKYLERAADYQKLIELNRQKDILDE